MTAKDVNNNKTEKAGQPAPVAQQNEGKTANGDASVNPASANSSSEVPVSQVTSSTTSNRKIEFITCIFKIFSANF
ncbi:MAG: hypothetical protein IPG39_11220 [Bacteroidetes bacterium]|nr:hypothetical protein [Bacteroidota bacterium]